MLEKENFFNQIKKAFLLLSSWRIGFPPTPQVSVCASENHQKAEHVFQTIRDGGTREIYESENLFFLN